MGKSISVDSERPSKPKFSGLEVIADFANHFPNDWQGDVRITVAVDYRESEERL
jgi:hypothetical protein